jgi:NAD(P)-dependent dehydrogenase (short-subunit alcohol dehydrogenase family)
MHTWLASNVFPLPTGACREAKASQDKAALEMNDDSQNRSEMSAVGGDRDAFLSGLFGLDGLVAVVTGAADGFGKTIALALARVGAGVVTADVDSAGLAATDAGIAALGVPHLAVTCDVGSEEEVQALFHAVDREFNRVDILVNNAGILVTLAPPEAYPLSAWEATMRVNVTGAFLCAREAGRRMIDGRRGGSIVNLSSIGGVTALGGGSFSYDVSKSAVAQMTRELAIEWAQYGIRVNALAPCQFLTSGWAQAKADPAQAETIRAVVRGIPLGRMGDPDEIVGPVLFLLSAASSMVSGVVLPVDGGNLAMNATAGGVMAGDYSY